MFYKTRLACSLPGIREQEQVRKHYLKGSLFENLILKEFIKRNYNRGENRAFYYWQDNHGKEIGCVFENKEDVVAVEMKSGKKISTSYFDNLTYWQKMVGQAGKTGYVVYGGDQSMKTSAGQLVSWRELDRIPA